MIRTSLSDEWYFWFQFKLIFDPKTNQLLFYTLSNFIELWLSFPRSTFNGLHVLSFRVHHSKPITFISKWYNDIYKWIKFYYHQTSFVVTITNGNDFIHEFPSKLIWLVFPFFVTRQSRIESEHFKFTLFRRDVIKDTRDVIKHTRDVTEWDQLR
jgi:hypothetical protein